MIEASLQGTPTPSLSAEGLYKGMTAADAYSNAGGITNNANFLNYIKSIGFKVNTILPERTGGVTDTTLASIKQALSQGALVLAHTSTAISGITGGSTSGHFMVVYAYDASGNFYVANPGARADSPPEGHAFSPDKIKSWLDGFYAVSK
jgi:hypothetical protein